MHRRHVCKESSTVSYQSQDGKADPTLILFSSEAWFHFSGHQLRLAGTDLQKIPC